MKLHWRRTLVHHTDIEQMILHTRIVFVSVPGNHGNVPGTAAIASELISLLKRWIIGGDGSPIA